MRYKYFIAVIALLVSAFITLADSAEVVLQNGHNGYEGCVDTYIRCVGPDTSTNTWPDINSNFADNITIETANCNS